MKITKNGVYMFVGANGAGKTTMAKKILKENRSICCMMKQDDNQILERETVLTNITMNELPEEEVMYFLENQQLSYLLTKKSKYLSGGEKRLVNLLRAVLSGQEVIILDEPSNDLDIDVFEKAKQIIYQTAKTKIVLLITHDDRFTEYEKKLEIIQNKIYNVTGKLLADEIRFEKAKEVEREIKLKPRKTYFLFVFYFLCTTIVAACLLNLLMANSEELMPVNEKGKYQLAALYSSNSSAYDNNEAINTALIQSAIKFNKTEFLNEEGRINDDEHYEQSINLKSNTYQTLIYLELYNPKTKEFMDIKTLMMDNLKIALNLNENLEFISDDETYYKNRETPYFYIPNNIALKEAELAKIKAWGYEVKYNRDDLEPNQIKVDFNPTVYSESLAKINLDDVFSTEAYVELRADESFYDFLSVNKLYAKKLWIKGYEPELLNAETNQYSSAISLIQKMLIIIGMLVLILFILLYIYEVNYKNSYSTLTYYGYNKKKLVKFRKKTYMTTKFKVFSVIVLVIELLVMWMIVPSFVSLAIVGVAMLFYLIAYAIIPLTIKYNIRKVSV